MTQQEFIQGPITPGGLPLDAGTVGTSQLASGAVTKAKMAFFAANGRTGTGSSQNIAHGLGVTPSFVTVVFTGSTASQAVTYGSHTSTNVVVTVTSGATFDVLAFA